MTKRNIYELEDLLPELYGETPRRISHQSGMLLAGVPLTVGWHISADIEDNGSFIESHIVHIPESSETMFIDSELIADNTWLSSPERSILEEAEHMPKTHSAKIISRCLDMVFPFDWSRIADVADDLKYFDGLRRIASMSDAISTWEPPGYEDESYDDLMNYVQPTSRSKDWLRMLCWGGIRSADRKFDVIYKDEKHKVIWEKHPYQIFEDLMT